MNDSFDYRSYGRTELAQLYNPHLTPQAAWCVLQRWIEFNVPLKIELQKLGLTDNQRRYTPAMVRVITQHLGEP